MAKMSGKIIKLEGCEKLITAIKKAEKALCKYLKAVEEMQECGIKLKTKNVS